MSDIEIVRLPINEVSLAHAVELLRRATLYTYEHIREQHMGDPKVLKAMLMAETSRKLADHAIKRDKMVFREVPKRDTEAQNDPWFERTTFEARLTVLSDAELTILMDILREAIRVVGPQFKNYPRNIP